MSVSSSLIFVLLEMFLEVSPSYSVSYRGNVYQPIEHHALLGQSFMNISGISAVRCSARCLRHHGCFSFNYDHINKVCQMNNATAEQVFDNFQVMLPFSYYEATATPVTCQINSVSVNGKHTKACNSYEKLGLEDGSIPDESLSASGNYDLSQVSTAAGGRLNKIPPDNLATGAWLPKKLDTNQWIQVDLSNPTYVTGVLTQGHSGVMYPMWVTKYKVQFEPPSSASLLDVIDQHGKTQIFVGNVDSNGIVERRFFKPVLAVKIRIVPVEWSEFIALRFELLGCK